ncbi:MAG: DNA repair protein RecN [bacterium]|jgi:DNA repair protein RecN (Recombination protein N)|nr:DNA repair protein RecN [bacterium]
MLHELRVRDLALVEQADVTFGPGLNLLTGETGSGKSLLVDALGLALGDRASAEHVRHGARRALAEATFHVGARTVELAREVSKRGAARADGAAVSVSDLAARGRRLVAVHGQHEQQALLQPETHARLLDAQTAGSDAARGRVAEVHGRWRQASDRVQSLEQARARGSREREYLKWQLDELRAADPQPGEDGSLAAERSVARHAVHIAELTQSALGELHDDRALSGAGTTVRQAASLDPRLTGLADRLDLLAEEADDVAGELRRYVETADTDPERLEVIEERLARLEQLKRKHGGTLEAVLAERARLESELESGEDLGAALEAAREELAAAQADLEAAAWKLTQARSAGALELGTAVTGELRGLRLHDAIFEVRLFPRASIGPDGAEDVEMFFTANPGEPPAPLARVASGGELSRVMLALETVGAESGEIPTLVFDEVDAGIGGETALEVGRRLRTLGEHRQVLVVTHLAQIACFADRHLVVEKHTHPGGHNVVGVRDLRTDEDRAHELARMMSGAVTAKALARAQELLEEARQATQGRRPAAGKRSPGRKAPQAA